MPVNRNRKHDTFPFLFAGCLLFIACQVFTPKGDEGPQPTGAEATDAQTAHQVTFLNSCTETVWVGALGTTAIGGGGWEMAPSTTVTQDVPVGWSGRFWPRTGCTFGAQGLCASGSNCCTTGGCLVSDDKTFGLQCAYSGVAPVSLIEFTFDAAGGHGPYDTYDVSFVDGWGVPVGVGANTGTYNPTPDPGLKAPWCTFSGCTAAPTCPTEYAVAGSPDSCWSPCQHATNTGSADQLKLCCACSKTDGSCTCPNACCAGAYGCSPYTKPANPADMTCDPWASSTRGWDTTARSYIANVKAKCPQVYAWQFDDAAATFNCRKTGGLVAYTVEFCPKIAPAAAP